MSKTRQPEIGEPIVYHDNVGKPHNALVTCVFETCINLVMISSDTSKEDTYGRQTERATSCSHKFANTAHGNYWRFPEEGPNPVQEPVAK